jgi:uncharacterized protein YkwD
VILGHARTGWLSTHTGPTRSHRTRPWQKGRVSPRPTTGRAIVAAPSGSLIITALVALGAASALAAPPVSHADNKRLNDGVVANVYTIQRQHGCTTDIRINPQLRLAAQWHANDVLNNRGLNGDVGSDGTSVQDRANAAGFHGIATETVAINPALAINGIEVLQQWYYRPDYMAIMSDCANTQIGVWSENSLDRSVVVAVYGLPS